LSGIPELIEHERTGLLVDPEDPVDLAAAIVRLLDDQALRRRLQVHARRRVESDFNLASTARQLAGLIEDSVARRRDGLQRPHDESSDEVAVVTDGADAPSGAPA
jgi:glycosyltransferase involved in cell wall biosynthesis